MHSIEYRYFYQSALDSSIRKASQTLNSMMGMMSGLYGNLNFGGMTDNNDQKQ